MHEILQAMTLEWVAIPFSGDLATHGLNPHCRQIPYCLSPQGTLVLYVHIFKFQNTHSQCILLKVRVAVT